MFKQLKIYLFSLFFFFVGGRGGVGGIEIPETCGTEEGQNAGFSQGKRAKGSVLSADWNSESLKVQKVRTCSSRHNASEKKLTY
jgi:hypothetical protein